MRVITPLILLLTSLLLISGCGQRKDIVAKTGREVVTVEEFKSGFITKFRGEDGAKRRGFNERKEYARELALSAAKYQEALARGYEKDPEISKQIDAVARRRALDYLYRSKVTDQVITEGAVRHFYDQSAKEVRARHILLKSGPADTTDAARAVLEARMDSIKQLIEGGLDFKEAAVQFSEDATTAPDSGDLEWFPWGRMVNEFQEAAWKAGVGEMVGPIRTPYGYHLILVTEIRDVAGRRSFEDMKDDIKMRLRSQEAARLSERAREYVDGLCQTNELELKDGVLEAFREKLQDPAISKAQELGPSFTGEEKAKVAASYKGGTVTVQDLIEKVGTNAHRVDWTDTQVTFDLVHAVVEPMFLEEVAEREGFLKQAMKDDEVLDQQRKAIIARLEKIEIQDKVNPTEEQEETYYETHLDQFIRPEHREIREIFIKEDSAKAARVHARAVTGEDFLKLALRFNEKESTKPDTGRLGPFEQRRFGLIGKTAFKLEKEGDISDVVKVGKNFSVIKLERIIPSRTKTWLEAKSQARREYRMAQIDAAEQDLETMLFEKYPLKIFEDKLAAVWPLEDEEEEKLAREP